MLLQQYEAEIHYAGFIFHDFPLKNKQFQAKKNFHILHYILYLLKRAIQFLPLSLRDTTSCLSLLTICFSCLLAETFDTSVDGPTVHKTAERHISAEFPQGVTEGSISADPCLSVIGSVSEIYCLFFQKKTER